MRPLFQRAPQLLLRVRQFGPKEYVRPTGSKLPQLSPFPKCVQYGLVRGLFQPPRRQYSAIGGPTPPRSIPEPEKKKEESTAPKIDVTSPTPAPPGVDPAKLPSATEKKRTEFSRKISAVMNDLQGALFVAGKRLNELTGYSGIEQMKKSIEAQEEHVRLSRAEVRAAKDAYQAAINRRSASQREVNELLQRKHAWTASDLERFTSLYRNDHANEQEEVAAQDRLTRAEMAADDAQSLLTKSILTRYHEEQIWSDKIRSASTWVTWALMGFNVFLFVIVQLGLEPWRRRRLVGGFEEKVREVIHEEAQRNALLQAENLAVAPRSAVVPGENVEAVEAVQEAPANSLATKAVEETLSTVEGAAAELGGALAAGMTDIDAGALPVPGTEMPAEVVTRKASPLENWQDIDAWTEAASTQAEVYTEKVKELFSEEVITVRKVDVTTVALESAAAGAVLTGIIAFILSNR
ncbi:putative mitochondrion biogenesis protein [Peziza echinospora]|nr:putative mitochondrion biogenesis protein [Peziza echinospora]